MKLSEEDQEIFTNPIFFQRKVHINNYIVSLLGKLNEQLENDHLVQQVIAKFKLPLTRGKISKGENYLGYPWQILDYPRVFEKENIFAFRTMCWWGNFYNSTLHIGGSYYENHMETFSKKLQLLKDQPVYICVNDKQWDHHFEINNYLLLKEVYANDDLFKKTLNQKFLKLSCKFPLDDIEHLQKNAIATFKLFLQ